MTDQLSPSPQFGTAEYVGTAGGDHCQFCHQPIGTNYFRVNHAMACASCADRARGELAKDTHSAFARAVLFGVGAAVLGLVLYAAFEIITSITIGYAALAVGWIIGKAMITASGGIGGRRYQIVAVLLTYAAVSLAAVPVAIHYFRQHPEELHKKSAQSSAASSPDSLSADSPDSSSSGADSNPVREKPGFRAAMMQLALLGLASPFLDLTSNPLGGLIGLFILFIGMRFAWRFTAGRPLEVSGPFENKPKPIG
jgi:hypothetical protein